MNEIEKELLALEVKALAVSGHPLNKKTAHKKYPSKYFADYRDNLFGDMSDEHRAQYARGNGGELLDKQYPAKMKSVFSSSAMTFNLLGNGTIRAKDGNSIFVPGTYKIEYEKKLLTVKNNGVSSRSANLDAFLLNGTDAIFCEMKMIEWLRDTPGFLKKAYFENKNSFLEKDAFNDFEKLQKSLCANMSEYKADDDCDPHRFSRYDAWQMYKHILGIYNMSSVATKTPISSFQTNEIQPLPKLKKVRLINVIFEPPLEVFDEKTRSTYCNYRAIEHGEFSIFKRCVEESGILTTFKNDCGFDFSLELLTAAQFMDCFELGGRADYLQRYRLEKRS